MKSLILKDLYNISHNSKSLAFILLFLALTAIPTSDAAGYVFACAAICSLMVVTTFSFDDASKWDAYALVMPVSRRDVVGSKYLVLLIFSLFGATVGVLVGGIGGMAAGLLPKTAASFGELAVYSLIALVSVTVVGGTSIPLILKFGPEQGRMMIFLSALIPAGLVFLGYQVLKLLGIEVTDALANLLLALSPLAALVWNGVMYTISCRIYEKKEV